MATGKLPQALANKPQLDSTIAPYIEIFYRLHNTRRDKYTPIDIDQIHSYCLIIEEEDMRFLDQVISTADYIYIQAIRKIDEDNALLVEELNSTLQH